MKSRSADINDHIAAGGAVRLLVHGLAWSDVTSAAAYPENPNWTVLTIADGTERVLRHGDDMYCLAFDPKEAKP
jgi:hypothetical protein